MPSSGTGRYTCLSSVKLWIIASQKHWQRVCDIVFLEISCEQIYLQRDSKPAPLTVGNSLPCKDTALYDKATAPRRTRQRSVSSDSCHDQKQVKSNQILYQIALHIRWASAKPTTPRMRYIHMYILTYMHMHMQNSYGYFHMYSTPGSLISISGSMIVTMGPCL